MDYLKEYGINTYINAHDTVTLYGGSRMAANAKEASEQIARVFVDLRELQITLGKRIAALTRNEGAYITGGAAAGVQLCAAVCLARGSHAAYRRLPDTDGIANKIIVLHSQHNCYDKAIEATGGVIQLVGDADEVPEYIFEDNLSKGAAAVFLFPSLKRERSVPSLAKVAEIAHRYEVPVIVDAAAQLPPVENLWNFTQQGADMVIFSGGKTLCGPQASGLIVGKQKYIDDCIRFGSPTHGVCRSSKASREDMIGLCVAVENYCRMDHEEHYRRLSEMVDYMISRMKANPLLEPFRVDYGPVGQAYPRAFARVKPPLTPNGIARKMCEQRVYIGVDSEQEAIYLSPLNLSGDEADTVLSLLLSLCDPKM